LRPGCRSVYRFFLPILSAASFLKSSPACSERLMLVNGLFGFGGGVDPSGLADDQARLDALSLQPGKRAGAR
jgi:hypothetical protein